MTKSFFKYFLWISILACLYTIVNAALYFNSNLFHGYMSWNVFLAWVPLGVSAVITMIDLNKKIPFALKVLITILLGALWLLFYPNSTYIITDFIHISKDFQILKEVVDSSGISKRVFVFNDDLNIWIEFFGIASGVFIGYLSGVFSLFHHEEFLRKKFGIKFSSVFLVIIHILTGYALTIGRFERWNSWDAFNPSNIIKIIINHLNFPSLKFTLLFSAMSILTYLPIAFLVRAFLPGDKK